MVPGSAAHKCGLLEIQDQLVAVENENVFGWSLKVLRQRIHGTPGTHVTLGVCVWFNRCVCVRVCACAWVCEGVRVCACVYVSVRVCA